MKNTLTLDKPSLSRVLYENKHSLGSVRTVVISGANEKQTSGVSPHDPAGAPGVHAGAEAHQTTYVERPVLDEDAMEEMQRTVQEAMSTGTMLTLHVYQGGTIREITMVPKWLQQDRLKGYSVDGAMKAVDLGDIVGVS